MADKTINNITTPTTISTKKKSTVPNSLGVPPIDNMSAYPDLDGFTQQDMVDFNNFGNRTDMKADSSTFMDTLGGLGMYSNTTPAKPGTDGVMNNYQDGGAFGLSNASSGQLVNNGNQLQREGYMSNTDITSPYQLTYQEAVDTKMVDPASMTSTEFDKGKTAYDASSNKTTSNIMGGVNAAVGLGSAALQYDISRKNLKLQQDHEDFVEGRYDQADAKTAQFQANSIG